MKRCSSCKVEKDLSEFHKDKRNKDGLHYACKDCRNVYHTSETGKAYKRKRYHRGKAYIRAQKKPCIVCGEDEPVCIDFHHLRDKKFNLANTESRSLDTIQKEIDKCVCLCSNCHRKHHAGLIDLTPYITTT